MQEELVLLVDCGLFLLRRDDQLIDGVVSLAHDRKREGGHRPHHRPQLRLSNKPVCVAATSSCSLAVLKLWF